MDNLAASEAKTGKRDTKPQASKHKPGEEDLDHFFGEARKSSGQLLRSISDEDEDTLLPHGPAELSDEEEDGGGREVARGKRGGGVEDIDLEELLRKKMGWVNMMYRLHIITLCMVNIIYSTWP